MKLLLNKLREVLEIDSFGSSKEGRAAHLMMLCIDDMEYETSEIDENLNLDAESFLHFKKFIEKMAEPGLAHDGDGVVGINVRNLDVELVIDFAGGKLDTGGLMYFGGLVTKNVAGGNDWEDPARIEEGKLVLPFVDMSPEDQAALCYALAECVVMQDAATIRIGKHHYDGTAPDETLENIRAMGTNPT